MDTIKINKCGVKIIAHRGLSGIEKENSNSAFVAAGNRSYFGIESDVHKTADGKFVIIHDETTARVSDVDIDVEKTDYDTVRSVTLNDVDGKTGRADLIIPSLAEYISICKKYEKKAVLELKNRFSEKDIAEIISIIKELDYLYNVIFISFDKENLIVLRSLEKDQPIQYLTVDFNDEILETLVKYNFDLDISYNCVTSKMVETLHNHNLKINCWTCDNADDAGKLIDMGVDFITSNILE